MGFYSWKTADSKESIANECTDRCKPVFLLQPHGLKPIHEPSYEGYGRFGGVDAHIWLAQMNMAHNNIKLTEEEDMRAFGIMLNCEGINYRPEHDDYWAFGYHSSPSIEVIKTFTGNYGQFCPKLGGVPNEMLESGKLIKKSPFTIKYPLKFSFNKSAVYEDLPASEDCEFQGYFYD